MWNLEQAAGSPAMFILCLAGCSPHVTHFRLKKRIAGKINIFFFFLEHFEASTYLLMVELYFLPRSNI